MHNNLLWKAFLFVVLVYTLGYSAVAAYRYYEYARLTEKKTLTYPIVWDVFEKSDENYILISKYTYEVNGHLFHGEMPWSDEPYRNAWAAKKAIEAYKKQTFTVWYDPSHPDYSSLQKHPPLKECVYALILWGLLLYFVWLGYYVAGRNDNNNWR